MRVPKYLLCFCVGVLCASFSFASHINVAYDFTSAAYGSSDFSLQGNSEWVSDGGLSPNNRLRLTSNALSQVGSAWFNNEKINASRDWAVTYRWQFSYANGGGADGLGFHIQTQGTNVNVVSNYAQNNTGWLSINVDSWQNTESGEVSGSALAVFFNGTFLGWMELGGLGNSNLNDDMYRNDISYNKDLQQLTVTVTDETTTNSTTQYFSADLGSVFNNETDAYVGFSANTGGAGENHDLLYFAVDAVPEPTTLGLLAGGAALLAWRRKRRS